MTSPHLLAALPWPDFLTSPHLRFLTCRMWVLVSCGCHNKLAQPGWFKQPTLIVSVLEALNPRSSFWLMGVWGKPSFWLVVYFLLAVSSRGGQREQAVFCFLCRDNNPLGPHFFLYYFITANSAILGVRASTYAFGGRTPFSPSQG